MDSPPVAPSAPPETPDETIRRLTAELHEAHQQQAAMTEILGIINSSPGNLAPVFDAILQKAHTLCGADHGNLWTYDGEFSHPGATRGNPRYAKWLRGRSSVLPTPGTVLERIVRGEDFLHIADAASDQAFCTSAYSREVIELTGARTTLIISLRKDTALLGVIFAYRQEVRPFSEKQIALFKSFAAQAVIAMENARLITETREALEQQTATAEVLQVINSSPGDLVPVFEAMLDRAIRLCEAAHGHLLTYDGECFHPAADSGEPHYIEWARQVSTVRPAPKAPLGRISRGERIVHIADLREEKVYHTDSGFREQVDIRSARSQITVGLLKDNILLGAMIVYRQEVRPFSDKQIALLENFAAQAVIAMENVRLLTETREALEQQTATAEVMQVINSSPGDLAPVFDAILEKARILCAATFGALFLSEEGNFRAAAMRGGTEAWRDRMMQRGFEGSKTPISAPLLAGEAFVHVVDMAQIDHPMAQAAVESVGVRSLLAVPLRKEDALCGIIVASRPEVRPFSDKQIALLQNFAAQAVIAMENARLLTETREALEQQTATTEVLQVINSSPGDLAPVFDAMLEKAVRLCDFAFAALWTYEGSRFRPVALHGMPKPFEEFLREHTSSI